MSEQYAFNINVNIVVLRAESYEDAMRQARETADAIYTTIESGYVVLHESEGSLLDGPDGVFCDGCDGHVISGVRWPTCPDGRSDHEYVERCDTCARFEDDNAARDRVVEFYYDSGATIHNGEKDGFLYVDVS